MDDRNYSEARPGETLCARVLHEQNFTAQKELGVSTLKCLYTERGRVCNRFSFSQEYNENFNSNLCCDN